MANLFRCGGGSGKVEETTSIVIPKSQTREGVTNLFVPDEVKMITIKDASVNNSNTQGDVSVTNKDGFYDFESFSTTKKSRTFDVSNHNDVVLSILGRSLNDSGLGTITIENIIMDL